MADTKSAKRAAAPAATRTARSPATSGKAGSPKRGDKGAKPAASRMANAKIVFKDFSLSRSKEAANTKTYVSRGIDPSTVSREMMASRLDDIPDLVIANQYLRTSLPTEMLKALLKSLDESEGTVGATDLPTLLKPYLRGTEFYARGNPSLARSALQSQVDAIFESITTGEAAPSGKKGNAGDTSEGQPK